MTGKQVAKNLRGSRRKWGQSALYDHGAMCVLGLKAFEAGVPTKALKAYDNSYDKELYGEVEDLYALNDNADSKADLIATLESPDYAKTQFDVEGFIKRLKAWWKKHND